MYDVIVRNGRIYDGSGSDPFVGHLAIDSDTIALVSSTIRGRGKIDIDAAGLAVSPGFINMLSWANESLIYDGFSQSDIRQGVTLEVFGEGRSMGPLNGHMKTKLVEEQGDITYEVLWTTLGEYLDYLEKKGVSTNVASFVGATTVRIHELGHDDRPPTPEELHRMGDLVGQAMEEGALGVGSSLIYVPAFFAGTEELIELCKVAARYGGMYISHIRNEGNRLLEAIDEFLTIAERANIPAEMYHFKAAGKKNHHKMEPAIARIEKARSRGLRITADMYPYTAGATGLDAAMPPWCQEGGLNAWTARLKDSHLRKQIFKEMQSDQDNWENLLALAGPDSVVLVGFNNDDLKNLTGKTVAEVAEMRGTSPEETAMDLVIEDHSRVRTVYFLMWEENVRKKITRRWMSFCSDEESLAPEGEFTKYKPHPRAYGAFARLLGKYVREEKLIPLREAVRRLTSFPAENMRLRKRGLLKEGYFADVVIFDPQEIQDRATYDDPHQYATGVRHVFVNGTQVLREGYHTGATPGRFLRGPGWKGWR
ncbi:MAG: amidohydrolase family protein [Fidelibacterota bacterium]